MLISSAQGTEAGNTLRQAVSPMQAKTGTDFLKRSLLWHFCGMVYRPDSRIRNYSHFLDHKDITGFHFTVFIIYCKIKCISIRVQLRVFQNRIA